MPTTPPPTTGVLDPATEGQGSTLKLGELRKLVTDTVAEALKGVTKAEGGIHADAEKHTETKLDRPSTVQAAVQAEIEKMKAHEKEEAEKADVQTKLAQLAKLTEEKPPVERRRVHKFMGWGE